jgi:hypothetical protein
MKRDLSRFPPAWHRFDLTSIRFVLPDMNESKSADWVSGKQLAL